MSSNHVAIRGMFYSRKYLLVRKTSVRPDNKCNRRQTDIEREREGKREREREKEGQRKNNMERMRYCKPWKSESGNEVGAVHVTRAARLATVDEPECVAEPEGPDWLEAEN